MAFVNKDEVEKIRRIPKPLRVCEGGTSLASGRALGSKQERLGGTAEAVAFQSKSDQMAKRGLGVLGDAGGAGLSPCVREKHAERKAQA
jgi:hypothetical protein